MAGGDAVTLEAKAAGLAGIVVWGLHRDSAELREVGLPVFSHGCVPAGPHRSSYEPSRMVDAIDFGGVAVSRGDVVFADGDGVLFLPPAPARDRRGDRGVTTPSQQSAELSLP